MLFRSGIGGITFDDTPTKEKLIELLLLKLPHLVEVLTVDKSIEELLFYINLVGQITFSFSDSINLNIPCNIKKITLTNGVTFSDSYNIESPNDDRSLLSDSFNITINSPSIRRIIFK